MTKQQENVQDAFLNKARKESVPVTIHVTNGFQIKNAIVKSYDSFVVLVEVDQQQMMLYKHAISTITPAKPIILHNEKEDC
ncbi:MAG: RNA chaperone Hfq [Eubacteriales bacterium]|nr:RNA chaperone Hfq [Eubacteriales bacterium]